ncbi:MAG: ATP/GTP-binding protein [Thermoplasmatota archaeon]
MEGKIGLYLIGTAGCGKSTLTAALAQLMTANGISTLTMNLDPGADILPYEPDIDVRDWITLGDVMEEYGLGPNGAQIVAADMLALYKNRLVQELEDKNFQYLLIDTPGQLELFSFREASKEVVKGLRPNASFLIYMIDPFNSRTPSGYMSQLMLSNLTKLRFHFPSLDVISKYDMVGHDIKEELDRWQDYPEHLLDDLIRESSEAENMGPELSVGMYKAMDEMGLFSKHMPVSAASGEGLEEVLRKVQLTYGQGEDPENEE